MFSRICLELFACAGIVALAMMITLAYGGAI
jgi:hypothetical protein